VAKLYISLPPRGSTITRSQQENFAELFLEAMVPGVTITYETDAEANPWVVIEFDTDYYPADELLEIAQRASSRATLEA
jgi:hypothetical protein